MFNLKDITVIVPTTLENISEDWTKQINNYSKNKLSIIIVVPPKTSSKKIISKKFSDDIKILKSKFKGQVSQRQYGYKYTKTKLILHMDDDIYFDLKSLKGLLNIFNKLSEDSCLAPSLKLNKNNNKNIIINLIKNIFLYFDLKPKPGTIALSSFPVKHSNGLKKNKTIKVEWLPGGISLLRKVNCIKENYFKFKGKAYCEDLIHSYFLNRNNIKLYINTSYEFKTKVESYRFLNLNQFLVFLKNDFKIRNYYRKTINNPLTPFLLAYFYLIISFLMTKIINKIRFKLEL